MSRLARPCWTLVAGSDRAHFVVKVHLKGRRANQPTEADTICGHTFPGPSKAALPDDARRCGRCVAVLERALRQAA